MGDPDIATISIIVRISDHCLQVFEVVQIPVDFPGLGVALAGKCAADGFIALENSCILELVLCV